MVVEPRRISLDGHPAAIFELEGEAWEQFGRNYSFRRIEILPGSLRDPTPLTIKTAAARRPPQESP